MTTAEVVYPKKTRELHNVLMDSTRWDGFDFRDGDIVIDTWAKSGTTWTQQIVAQLVFEGAEGLPAMDLAPWVDMRAMPKADVHAALAAQTHRRFMKSHLPADALDILPHVKYIFLGRDGRDVAWSWYNHLSHHTPEFFEMVNSVPGRVGPSLAPPECDVHEFFRQWLDRDGGFYDWSYWSHVQSWWDIRHLPNVRLVHFNNLKSDMPGSIRHMAEFLQIDIDESHWPEIVEHCSFAYMKKHADSLSNVFKDAFDGGLKSFVHKGTNGRWRDVLTDEDIQKYEDTARAKLTPDCAHWHETGELPS